MRYDLRTLDLTPSTKFAGIAVSHSPNGQWGGNSPSAEVTVNPTISPIEKSILQFLLLKAGSKS